MKADYNYTLSQKMILKISKKTMTHCFQSYTYFLFYLNDQKGQEYAFTQGKRINLWNELG